MGVPIVGRGDELAQLRAALVAASGGAGRLILISGEPGIGKTRLAGSLADMAGDYEVPVAVGCAIDDRGMPPLWPWHEVSRSVSSLADALPGVPDGAGGRPAVAHSQSARFAMFAAACRALAAAAAERGLLVILEDLQWAEQPLPTTGCGTSPNCGNWCSPTCTAWTTPRGNCSARRASLVSGSTCGY
jgi:hypothetical protein